MNAGGNREYLALKFQCWLKIAREGGDDVRGFAPHLLLPRLLVIQVK